MIVAILLIQVVSLVLIAAFYGRLMRLEHVVIDPADATVQDPPRPQGKAEIIEPQPTLDEAVSSFTKQQ